jgi:type IX secretion system PorP/SprF family membrane protein
MPNIGAGFYLYSERFYFGISSPRLVENDLRRNISTNAFARQERHFYLATGAAISLRGDAIIFKPSLLVRNVGIDNRISQDVFFSGVGAPDAFDLDLSFLFQETLWLGAAFRSAFSAPILSTDPKSSYDSADIWISYLFRNGLRIGAAYDFPISDLANVTVGSVELMVGYDFNFQEKRIVTPRYF